MLPNLHSVFIGRGFHLRFKQVLVELDMCRRSDLDVMGAIEHSSTAISDPDQLQSMRRRGDPRLLARTALQRPDDVLPLQVDA